jgi:hypothetical protein
MVVAGAVWTLIGQISKRKAQKPRKSKEYCSLYLSKSDRRGREIREVYASQSACAGEGGSIPRNCLKKGKIWGFWRADENLNSSSYNTTNKNSAEVGILTTVDFKNRGM